MQQEIPTLQFIPADRLLIHERHDLQRSRPLILRIRSSGVLKNPPIVSPFADSTARYMVLDGANRVTALREMGFPDILVQVVPIDDPGLRLQTWNHVIWELNPDRFLRDIKAIPGLHLSACADDQQPSLQADCGLALVRLCNGRSYSLCCEAEDLQTRVSVLNQIVDSYKDHCRLDRTSTRDVASLVEIYPQLSGLVIFPSFQIETIMCLAGEGYLLPSGITRFTISPRALHVNYPLDELAAHVPVEAKNERLQQWLKQRLEKRGVRYYAEATVLFDE